MEENLRELGVGKFIVNEAKKHVLKDDFNTLCLDTFNTNLNQFYKKLGAVEVCDSKSFNHPTTILRF